MRIRVRFGIGLFKDEFEPRILEGVEGEVCIKRWLWRLMPAPGAISVK